MEEGDLPLVEWRLTYLGSESAWPASEKVSQRANDQLLFMWINIYSYLPCWQEAVEETILEIK